LEAVGIFYSYLVYFVVILYILWPFGTFNGQSVYFSRFGMLHKEKSGNPGQMSIISPAQTDSY
jgi:hypothetical protein